MLNMLLKLHRVPIRERIKNSFWENIPLTYIAQVLFSLKEHSDGGHSGVPAYALQY